MAILLEKSIYTQNNNPIQLFKKEPLDKSSFKTVLFIGVFHGDEPEGEQLILNLIKELDEAPDLTGNQVLFIPVFNPDGKNLNTRGNANGVDLNRNFPTENWIKSESKDLYYSGEAAASEIEAKFMIEVIEKYSPDIIVSIHNPYKIVNFDGPAEDLAKKFSKLNGYPVQEDIGYPTPGSFGTYAGIERQIQVITLELPDNTDIEKLWNDNKQAFLMALNA